MASLAAAAPPLAPLVDPHLPWISPAALRETPSLPTAPLGGGDGAAVANVASRRDSSRGDSTAQARAETATPDASPEALDAAYRRADYQGAEAVAMRLLADAEIGASVWITYIRSVANQGRLHEAGELNARALEHYPLDAELHYLHATLLMEAGWFSDAAAAARRSIYLDRKLTMGHILLGEALSRSGDQTVARNAFANALRLLEHADASEIVRAADGVTVSRLRQIATLRLRGVEGSGWTDRGGGASGCRTLAVGTGGASAEVRCSAACSVAASACWSASAARSRASEYRA